MRWLWTSTGTGTKPLASCSIPTSSPVVISPLFVPSSPLISLSLSTQLLPVNPSSSIRDTNCAYYSHVRG